MKFFKTSRFLLGIFLDNPDMDISPGDSTPTSETSYSVSSTPTAQMNDSSLQQQQQVGGSLSGVLGVSSASSVSASSSTANPQPILLANALPRLASHPPTTSTTNSTQQMHFSSPNINVMSGAISSVAGSAASSPHCLPSVVQQQGTSSNCHRKIESVLQTSIPASSPTGQQPIPVINTSGVAMTHIHHQQQQSVQSPATVLTPTGVSCSSDLHMNSNAPGPPLASVSNYQKVLSQTSMMGGVLTAIKTTDQIDSGSQKSIQTISSSLLRQQSQPQAHYIGSIGGVPTLTGITTDSTSNITNDSNHSGSALANLR